MKKVTMMLLAAVALVGLTGCVVKTGRKGKVISKQFQLTEFEKINISGNIDVYYSQGERVSVRAEGDERILSSLSLNSDGHTLTISQKPYRLSWSVFRGGVKLYVSSPDLTGVSMSGNGDFEADGLVDTDELHVQLTGNGDIDFKKVICDKIFLNLTGNGDINVDEVTAGAANIQLTGNGDVEIGGRVRKFDMKKMGNGDVDTSRLVIEN
ncbi:MAG: DUF2807 domain-containing protein [Prevotella sp.]|nr:DUF2807 domain-containing protein [Prevotella sp.]